MKEGFIMKYALFILLLACAPARAEQRLDPIDTNKGLQECLDDLKYAYQDFDTFDWNKAAACHSKIVTEKVEAERAELRDFLKHNPRYRVPGQSQNRCWGKPRDMPFERSRLTTSKDGMTAEIWYKDKLPAGCFEQGPWDNREVYRK